MVAGIGGLVALAGCFLPLESVSGQNSALIPGGLRATDYVLIAPICAGAVAIMAWASRYGSVVQGSMLGGGVIAVSSPWTTLFLLAMFAAFRASDIFGVRFGDGIGIGAIALAAGFAAALLGGFIVLYEAPSRLSAASVDETAWRDLE
jgi:hypothetical protein